MENSLLFAIAMAKCNRDLTYKLTYYHLSQGGILLHVEEERNLNQSKIKGFFSCEVQQGSFIVVVVVHIQWHISYHHREFVVRKAHEIEEGGMGFPKTISLK